MEKLQDGVPGVGDELVGGNIEVDRRGPGDRGSNADDGVEERPVGVIGSGRQQSAQSVVIVVAAARIRATACR